MPDVCDVHAKEGGYAIPYLWLRGTVGRPLSGTRSFLGSGNVSSAASVSCLEGRARKESCKLGAEVGDGRNNISRVVLANVIFVCFDFRVGHLDLFEQELDLVGRCDW